MIEYPSAERQSCGYAVRYMRWLYESGTAAEVGPDAMAVLGAVLTLEDAFHYRRPPNFFNAQLMDRCGFRSEHAFIRARQIAIDAGLLHYEAGKKRTPGRYWVRGFTAQIAVKAGRKPGESHTKAGPSTPRPNTPDPKEKRPRFSPPSVDDVWTYCRERRNRVDAEHFVNWYSANGWVQGKGKPIRDWKAAVRTWERNGHNSGRNGSASPPPERAKPMRELDPDE